MPKKKKKQVLFCVSRLWRFQKSHLIHIPRFQLYNDERLMTVLTMVSFTTIGQRKTIPTDSLVEELFTRPPPPHLYFSRENRMYDISFSSNKDNRKIPPLQLIIILVIFALMQKQAFEMDGICRRRSPLRKAFTRIHSEERFLLIFFLPLIL